MWLHSHTLRILLWLKRCWTGTANSSIHRHYAMMAASMPAASMTTVSRPKLFLIDTFGFIFRAYHARARSGAPPMRTTTGISTEAIYIFHNMLRKLVQSYSPQYM